MTPIICAQNIAAFLREKFEHYIPSDPEVTSEGINIYDGFLPKTTTAAAKKEQDPCIVIRPVEVVDDEEAGSVVKLQILAVVYNEDKRDGHLELYHILEFIRQNLLTNRLIGERYFLQLPMETMVPEEQPYPEWWGYMNLTYTIPQVSAAYFKEFYKEKYQ